MDLEKCNLSLEVAVEVEEQLRDLVDHTEEMVFTSLNLVNDDMGQLEKQQYMDKAILFAKVSSEVLRVQIMYTNYVQRVVDGSTSKIVLPSEVERATLEPYVKSEDELRKGRESSREVEDDAPSVTMPCSQEVFAPLVDAFGHASPLGGDEIAPIDNLSFPLLTERKEYETI